MKDRASRRRLTAVLAAAAAVALLLSGCSPSADATINGRPQLESPFPTDVSARLDAALEEAITLSGSSGAIAGVWAPWAGQWLVSPGTTTIGGTEPLSTDMRFRASSSTRAMTCTVLLKLVDEQRVKLSDPVTMYLKRMPGIDGITLGQLCQNTSGLADYRPELAGQFVNNPTRQWPPLEVVSSGLAANRVSEPGGAWADSDTGFILLGLALSAATNQDWASLYDHYIFGPLGMTGTSFPGSGEIEVPGPHPHGYASALDPSRQLVCDVVHDDTRLSPSMAWVAGGVVSTVGDLKTWAQALAAGALVSSKSAKAQWATVPLGANSASSESYGLGVQQIGPLRGHAGAIPGFLSAAFAEPKSGLTVVVMLNNSNAGAAFVQHLAQRLAAIVSKEPAKGTETAPQLELPWSEEQMVQQMQAGAVCQPPPAPAPAP
ncbi:serine hydrolase domain-containing protein [Glaciibacter sp. 2TAF33]|uniref:serine hydrolase domain-containing protein n=1 Tax=Glaciibacter sp. 2TAF33 TaxID=3233015 RepID=UPI003F90971D